MKTYAPRKGSKAELTMQMLAEGPMTVEALAASLDVRPSAVDNYLAAAINAGAIVKMSQAGKPLEYALSEAGAGAGDTDSDEPRGHPAAPGSIVPSRAALAAANPFSAISLDLDEKADGGAVEAAPPPAVIEAVSVKTRAHTPLSIAWAVAFNGAIVFKVGDEVCTIDSHAVAAHFQSTRMPA